MTMQLTAKAIFITNTFAQAYPQEHIRLWEQFEKEVPTKDRTGIYGADNVAYIRWLRTQNHPLVLEFLKEYIVQQSL